MEAISIDKAGYRHRLMREIKNLQTLPAHRYEIPKDNDAVSGVCVCVCVCVCVHECGVSFLSECMHVCMCVCAFVLCVCVLIDKCFPYTSGQQESV